MGDLYNKRRTVCVCVCMYPSSAHSFGPIGMKLGMDTPWDPGSDMGQVASAKREARGSEATEKHERKARWSEATENASAKPEGAKRPQVQVRLRFAARCARNVTREARQRG